MIIMLYIILHIISGFIGNLIFPILDWYYMLCSSGFEFKKINAISFTLKEYLTTLPLAMFLGLPLCLLIFILWHAISTIIGFYEVYRKFVARL